MLTSQLGIRLVLLIGGTVPLPASRELMQSFSAADVTADAEGQDGFQLTFTLAKDSGLDFSLLEGSTFDALNRVVIGVVMGASPEVLVDGVITHHQLVPSDQPGGSTLVVTGRGIGVLLELAETNRPYPNQPDSVIVERVLLEYAGKGLLGPHRVTPTTDVPIQIQRVPRQQETDLDFIKRLATRNGFVFYIEPITFGVSSAYWGPAIRAGLPQPALTYDLGPATNLTRLSFANDWLAPVGAEGSFIEPTTKMQIPIPALPALRLPPLAGSLASPLRTTLLRETANYNPAQAFAASLAAATSSPEPVTVSGELESVRYGNVLRPRGLVGLRGAGRTYDGTYYVRSVTHSISQLSYRQSFSLSREGTGALLPVVIP
jgi:hypothetical protein